MNFLKKIKKIIALSLIATTSTVKPADSMNATNQACQALGLRTNPSIIEMLNYLSPDNQPKIMGRMAEAHIMEAYNSITNALNATPLHVAVYREHIEAVNSLLQSGIDANELDGTGKTPLCYAVLKRNSAIVRLLVKHGANINEKLCELIDEAESLDSADFLDIIRFVIENGADVNKSINNITLLDRAINNNNNELAWLLINLGATITPEKKIELIKRKKSIQALLQKSKEFTKWAR